MSNKSKALCRKEVRKTHKLVKRLLRNQELYNKFANVSDEVHSKYFEENLDEKQLHNMWMDLEKFAESFKEAGGIPDKFQDFILTTFAFKPEIIKDMLNQGK